MRAAPPDRVLAGIHEFGTTALAFTTDGRRMVTGGARGELRVWDTASFHQLDELHGHQSAVRAILPLGAGALVSGGDDGRLILWHGKRIKAEARKPKVTALVLFHGVIVSGHADRWLRVWSADALQPLAKVDVGGRVVGLSAHDGQLAVALDHAILLLAPDFRQFRSIPVAHTPHDLQFSPDGRTLAAGSWFRLDLWDVASGTFRSIPTEHNGLLTSIAFSPDGRYVATLGRHTDSSVRVLDTRSFKVVERYTAHKLCGAIIRFSPDGKLLASGSDDESVHLYRTERFQSGGGAIPSAH